MNTTPVKTYQGMSLQELSSQLMAETDVTNVKTICKQMNAHLQKKDLIRKTELDKLQDLIQGQITKRITEKGDCFSNKDLLDYFKTINDTINRIDPDPANISEAQGGIIIKDPVIIQPGLSRDEKKQVMETVRAIIENAKNQAMTSTTNYESKPENIIQGEFKEINEQ